MVKLKKENIVMIVLIVVMLLAIIGVSYAAFNYSKTGTKLNSITTGSITMSYTESDSIISIDKALPTRDETGKVRLKEGEYFDFTVSSEIVGDININYEISAKDVTTSNRKIDGSNIKFYLTRLTDNGEEELMRPATYNEEINANSYTGRPTGEMSLYQGSMSSSESNRYRLRMWVDEKYNPQEDGGNLSFSVKINVYGKDGEKSVPTATETLLAKVNAEDLDYNTATEAQQKEMWTFSHPATEQTEALTDYRYIGNDPNNYVTFNNETWRIIGVFTVDDGTGKMEERLKIIRGEPITKSGYTYAWNNGYSYDTTVSQYEYSWANASLNHLLNEGYESESVNGSYYWNRTGGICYASGQYGEIINTESCSFTDTGLLDEAKEMIDNTTWYLGGIDWNNSSTTNVNAAYAYSKERGTDAYSDNIETSWVGKVGLMYLSDYGYSTSGINSTMDRNSCLESKFPNHSSNSNIDCYSSSWLTGEKSQFTITQSSIYGEIFYINSSSCAENFHYGYMNANLTPTVYLKSSIKITDGDGSSSNPYVLKL